MRGNPVEIRGVRYPSQQAAAAALGVSPSTLCDALRNGTADRVGLTKRHGISEPVTIRGVTYPSVPDAAAALGVSAWTVYSARRHGRLDRVGLGKDWRKR